MTDKIEARPKAHAEARTSLGAGEDEVQCKSPLHATQFNNDR